MAERGGTSVGQGATADVPAAAAAQRRRPQHPGYRPPPATSAPAAASRQITHLAVLALQAHVVHGGGQRAAHQELGRQVVHVLGVLLPGRTGGHTGAVGGGWGGRGHNGDGRRFPAPLPRAAAAEHVFEQRRRQNAAAKWAVRAAASLPVGLGLVERVHQAVVHAPGHCARGGVLRAGRLGAAAACRRRVGDSRVVWGGRRCGGPHPTGTASARPWWWPPGDT